VIQSRRAGGISRLRPAIWTNAGGVERHGQRGDDGGNGIGGQIAHGDGQKRVTQRAIIADVAAHGGDERSIQFGVGQERRIGTQ